jgi:hypothetical protein
MNDNIVNNSYIINIIINIPPKDIFLFILLYISFIFPLLKKERKKRPS